MSNNVRQEKPKMSWGSAIVGILCGILCFVVFELLGWNDWLNRMNRELGLLGECIVAAVVYIVAERIANAIGEVIREKKNKK